eukprot:gnl/MRDRNA2_/MRDRNA2_67640_c0_seq1.p1 gnl/MRDRNA2_/MRDRNA2_67640_c0~~gnl/MRDRNA2_/MRDRNA2_67640_c0_seq1.p1  ORF type:complete len:515 (-),score=97.09 gnl/MRDRNA2_/MRDRNA2_67640_c0_seq1:367-1911(-)
MRPHLSSGEPSQGGRGKGDSDRNGSRQFLSNRETSKGRCKRGIFCEGGAEGKTKLRAKLLNALQLTQPPDKFRRYWEDYCKSQGLLCDALKAGTEVVDDFLLRRVPQKVWATMTKYIQGVSDKNYAAWKDYCNAHAPPIQPGQESTHNPFNLETVLLIDFIAVHRFALKDFEFVNEFPSSNRNKRKRNSNKISKKGSHGQNRGTTKDEEHNAASKNAEQASNAPAGEHTATKQQKRLRRFYRHVVIFRNAEVEEKEELIKGFEMEVSQAIQSNSRPLDLFYQCIAWLTPPASAAEHASDKTMGEAAKLRIRAALQSCVRKALIRLLNSVDLADDQTRKSLDVILQLLHQMIHKFEDIHQLDVINARGGKEWDRIKKVLLSSKASLGAVCGKSLPKSSARPAVRNGRGTTSNRVRSTLWKPRGSKNFMEKNLLGNLMKAAMRKLPEQRGTYTDIANKIREDSELWSLAEGKLDCRLHVQKGKVTDRPVWEFRVGVRMPKFFKKTGLTVNRQMIWQ